jgi:HK97 family phage prohead protease
MPLIAEAGPRLETKFLPIDASAASADGHLEGYASLFGRTDASGDEVAKGAFAASLARGARRVKLLWQHDPAQPIGVWDDLQEDGLGLKARGRLITQVRAGAEALALLQAGAIDGLSIGYRAVRSSRLQDGGRKLLEVELWEISLVTFPMLDGARVTSAEEPAAGEAYRDLAATLDEARRLFV